MKRFLLITVILLAIAIPAHSANDVTGQTWLLDTAGSVWTETTQIVWIVWTAIGSDDDDLIIHDSSGGNLIVKLKGKAGVDMIVPFPGNSGLIPGMYLTTIDSGEVQVRMGKGQ